MTLITFTRKKNNFKNRKMVNIGVKLHKFKCFGAPLKMVCFQKYFAGSIYRYNLTTIKKSGFFGCGWGVGQICLRCVQGRKDTRVRRHFLEQALK